MNEKKPFDYEPYLQWFSYEHLKEGPARETSKKFHDLAHNLVLTVPHGIQLTGALNNLITAKDCAVRATTDKFGVPVKRAPIQVDPNHPYWRPIPPGELLLEEMTARGWNENFVCARLQISKEQFTSFSIGLLAVSEGLAHNLAALVGTSSSYWRNLQVSYEHDLELQKTRAST